MVNPLFAIYLTSEAGLVYKDFGLIISFSALTGLLAVIILISWDKIKKKLTFIIL